VAVLSTGLLAVITIKKNTRKDLMVGVLLNDFLVLFSYSKDIKKETIKENADNITN
jgi:hypothetical protein